MKTANRRILVSGNEPHGIGKIEAKSVKRVLRQVSRFYSIRKPLGVIAGIVVAVGITVALSNSVRVTGAHPVNPPESSAQLGSPPFANPSEVRSRNGKLRMVMEIVSGNYQIPNVGKQNLRQFRGWDIAGKEPAGIHTGPVAPGPTMRARLGEQAQIWFFNKIDDTQFPYTFVTDSKPGFSDFGCDKSGTRDAASGLVNPYPWSDIFPNCFHGSSTANIHFHGTHTSPDGLGDNVLLQLLPQVNQRNWTVTFNRIFAGGIPQRWADMPIEYKTQQEIWIKQYDIDTRAAAARNGLPPPKETLWEKNKELIATGQWPQYLMGAFPNYFDIPDYASGRWKAGQAPGTHWYHAHKHGSTSLHILNGLAGAFIIESNAPGGYDHVIRGYYGWGDTYGDHEKIFVFQQFDPTQNLEKTKNTATGGGPPSQGKGIKQVLVNGLFTPTIKMRPGEAQLWRMINATVGNNPGKLSKDLFDESAGFKFKQTAQDGVQLSPDNYNDQPFLTNKIPGGLALAAGNRADVLVVAPQKAGVYPFATGKSSKNPNGTTLYFVEVAGPAVTPASTFPTKWAEMPPYLNDLRPPGPRDIRNPNSPVDFEWEAGRTGTGLNPFPYPTPSPYASPSPTPYPNLYPPHFMINGQQFGQNGEQVDQCMPLDGLQDWILENRTTTSHPFHIHINPFQVIKIETPVLIDPNKPAEPGNIKYTSYEPRNNFIWQDTVALPSGQISPDGKTIWPSKTTIRQTYLDFIGTYVLHCHILAHEDRGMMQLVRVVPAERYPRFCQFGVPSHH